MSAFPHVKESLPHSSAHFKPLVSLVAPIYNEVAILEQSVGQIYAYMAGLESEYDWELILVNDGSQDGSAEMADRLTTQYKNLRVFHHLVNRNLGAALRTGFKHSKGDFVIVLDIDLSYAPEHIARLLHCIQSLDADIVVASPYMKGGKNTAVPFFRLWLSKNVNRFMRMTAGTHIHTFTGMVRVYKGSFLRYLNLKSSTYAINPEIIYKAILLRAKIEEIPAHLDWSFQNSLGKSRTSSIRVFKGILSGLMSGFIFRPYAFFMTIGALLLLLAGYVIGWIFVNSYLAYPEIAPLAANAKNAFTMCVAKVFQERPHSFFVGGTTLIVALLFLGIGFLSLQSKRYFDELFHLGTTLYREQGDRHSS